MVSPIVMSGGVGQLQLVVAIGVDVGFIWSEVALSAVSNACAIAVSSEDRRSSLWLIGEVGECCGVNVGDTASSSIWDTFAALSSSDAN